MTKRLYTKHTVAGVAPETLFTPEEHALVSQAEWDEHFHSREELLRWYLRMDPDKLVAAAYLINLATQVGASSIASFGAGPGVIEYVASLALPDDGVMLATDFDPWLVERTGQLLPGMATALFDLSRDDPGDLLGKTGGSLHMAVFLGSSYVMDDRRFVEFFHRLGEIGVRHVVDFQSGYLAPAAWTRSQVARFIGRTPPAGAKFHGLARTRGELRNLYRASGLRIESERAVGPYRYVAVLAGPN